MSATPGEIVLSLDRVTVRYGNVTALDDLSLGIRRGEVYALLGARGSGKTSLVRCAVGLERPSSGRAELLGRDPWKRRAELSAHVALIPQNPASRPARTPRGLLELLRHRREFRGLDAARDRLARLGVPPNVPLTRLSVREKAAALLALAWKREADLLAVDEPAASLEVSARRVLSDEIAPQLSWRGSAVLIATDGGADVEGIATRVGFLKSGRLVLDERLDRLKARFRRIRYRNEITETRADYGTELDSFDAVQVKVRGWGVDAIVSDYDERTFERFRATDGVVGAETLPISLDEIFRAVTGNRSAPPERGP